MTPFVILSRRAKGGPSFKDPHVQGGGSLPDARPLDSRFLRLKRNFL